MQPVRRTGASPAVTGRNSTCQGGGMVGSVVADRKTVIHSASFRVSEGDRTGRILSLKNRRGFRL